MNRIFLFIILITCMNLSLVAQPKLDIEPKEIKFRDVFQRNQEVLFINEGNVPLIIDSLSYYNSYFYFIRLNKPGYFPHTILPDDTLRMDCILSGYNYVTMNDTVDTMYVYNNGVKPLEDVRIKIDFFDDDFRPGTITGTVRYNNLPQSLVNLYFYNEGKYEVYQTITDNSGNYRAQLSPGIYLVTAEKDSFYTTFFGSSSDPFEAEYITVGKDSNSIADIDLTHLPPGVLTVSGTVFDKISTNRAAKGLVVIRKGTHTPNKVSADTLNERVISGVIKGNGSYQVTGMTQPGYYYLEAFSDFYLPGYFKSTAPSPVFWQEADSVYINNSLSNMNFQLTRDSSIGGGRVTGQIINDGILPGNETVVYARSVDYIQEFTHTISKKDNSFDLRDLPYGNYVLIAQQIGRNDSFSDTIRIMPGLSYYSDINLNFTTSITGEENFGLQGFELNQNYPNPFNPSTKITFSLHQREKVFLSVYNLLGQQVAVLADGIYEQGTYTLDFKPGNLLSSGVYIYRLQAGSITSSRKMIFIK